MKKLLLLIPLLLFVPAAPSAASTCEKDSSTDREAGEQLKVGIRVCNGELTDVDWSWSCNDEDWGVSYRERNGIVAVTVFVFCEDGPYLVATAAV